MSCLGASPGAVQSGGMWLGAVPGAGLWEPGLGLPGCTLQGGGEWLSCHPTWVSLAETECPALLAAALRGRRRSEQSVFLSPTVNHKRKHF